jgi:hypothetical protein
MTGFTLNQFGGKAPKVYARALPPNMAQKATNVRLDSGRLDPWKGNSAASTGTATIEGTISNQTKTIFKYSDSLWIARNSDADFVRSSIAEDPHERIYVTNYIDTNLGNYPRMTTASIAGNSTYYRLGMPAPSNLGVTTISPVVSTKTEEETPTSRSYIYTYVSAYGEEGEPSVPQVDNVLTLFSDQTATVNFGNHDASNHNIASKRIYRTDANGDYRFVADVGLNATSYEDQVPNENLGEVIPTSSFSAPPDENSSDHTSGPMRGLKSLPNGVFAGFSGKTILFSEPFQPHAYPEEYRLTVKTDIVSLAPLQNGLLVLTEGKPALITGSDPSFMSMTEIDSTLSCVSKRSVVDMGDAVIYASPDGLVIATETGVNLATSGIFTRDQWQDLSPESITAYAWEGYYIGFYSTGTLSRGFVFDPRGGANSYIDLDFHATAGFSDLVNDVLYLVVNGSLHTFSSGSNLNYTWKTKKFYIPRPINPAVAKVDCDDYGDGVVFKLYAGGSETAVFTRTVQDSSVFRLPSGYKDNEFEIQVEANVAINEICVYESAEEIGG